MSLAPVRTAARRGSRTRFAACALAGLLCATAAPTPLPAQAPHTQPVVVTETTLPDVEKLYGLSKLWQEVNYNFAFFDQVPELNWDSTYQAFIPQVLATGSTYEYYRVLQRFIALLHDGHTMVFMPEAMRQQYEGFSPWLQLQPVEGRLLVRNVGASLAREIPIGSEIVAVEGVPLTQYLQEQIFPYVAVSAQHVLLDAAAWKLPQGPADAPLRLAYVTPRGQRREITLRRDQQSRVDRWSHPHDSQAQRFEFRWLENRIAYVALNTFMTDSVAMDFEAVLPQLHGARGLVIDIRRNHGGNSGVGYRIASWLTNDTLETSRWRTREHRAAHKAWARYGDEHRAYGEMNAWYDGGTHGQVYPNGSGRRLIIPTVVLQGHNTGSAAEDFLIAIDAVEHITTMGQPSNGSTGQPLFVELPGGGGAIVVTKRDTYPDGRDFVGLGARPEIRVAPTVADVRADRDVVLQRAVAHLRQQLGR